MSRIVVTGSSSGLGRCIANELGKYGHMILPFDKAHGADVRNPSVNRDFVEEGVDVLVNCAGIVRLKWLRDMVGDDWNVVMDVNAKGIYKMSKHLLPALTKSHGTILNIVSSAAHVPMRTSLAYNASKAAALMMTRQMARELAPDITVFSVSPNRMKGTEMSRQVDEETSHLRGWDPHEVTNRQLAASLTGEETPPEVVAELIGFLLSSKERHRHLTGCDIPYGV